MEVLAGSVATPDPVVEVLVGLAGLVVIIFVHGAGIRIITRHFSERWVSVTPSTRRWRVDLHLGVTIAALSAIHFIETLLWAAPINFWNVIPSMRDSYYFVLESYTTLGAGDVVLPDRWRLIGPIIGMSGLFTFSWTAGVLVSVMNEFGRLDRAKAREKDGEPPY